jgi:hypothetical protein
MDQPEQLLPDDVLSEVLRRLGPHGTAASRCVCKAWRDVVDARRLLPADAHLLPLTLTGIFVVLGLPITDDILKCAILYFSRPGSPKITPKFDYMGAIESSRLEITDHRKGLLLLHLSPFYPNEGKPYVLNPATRQWTQLPTLPELSVSGREDVHEELNMYIAFDPTLSPHYQVFLLNSAPTKFNDPLEPALQELEWPPSRYILRVFSSRTSRWEMKQYIRQGEAAGTIGHMNKAIDPCGHAAYWHGALYVPQHDFIIK